MTRADPRLGAVLAERYRLDRAIGSGAMGAVYEAVHLGLGKHVAIKILHAQHKGSRDVEARFEREARAAATIISDHIVQTFDVGTDATHGLFLVTELLEGEDVDARLARERRLDVETAVTIGRQVARGLEKAHAGGIVHRDLKPANVFLTTRDDGSLLAKIVDFGISKRMHDEPFLVPLTNKGTAVGTPQYMAPEQLTGVSDIDGRADVWALGTLMYEMLTGASPFASRRGHLEIMMAIAREDAKPLRSVAPWVPHALAEAIDGALVRNRDLRTADVATLGAQLTLATAKRQTALRGRQSGTVRRVESSAEARQSHETLVLTDADVATEREPAPGRRRS